MDNQEKNEVIKPQGINTAVSSAQQKMAQTVNEMLAELPPVIVRFVVTDALYQLNVVCERVTAAEQQQESEAK